MRGCKKALLYEFVLYYDFCMKTLNIFASYLSFTILSLTVSSAQAAFENFPVYEKGRVEVQASTEYFKSDGNYRSGGNKDSLPGNFSYSLFDFNARPRFVVSRDLGFFGSLNVGQSESKDSIKTLTNSTLNWMSAGVDYRLIEQLDWTLITDAELIIPFEKVSTTMDSSLNWDGAVHLRGRAIGQFHMSNFVPYGYVGFDWRDQGLSTLALYGAGMMFNLDSLKLGGELNGFVTIIQDKYTNETYQRDQIITNLNASSKKFYSINPALLDSNFYLRYDFDKNWMLQAGGGLTLTGNESASGYHVNAMLRFAFGGADSAYEPTYHSDPYSLPAVDSVQPVAPVNQFHEDTHDGVDQKIFKPAPKPAPPADPDYKIKLKSKTKKK